MCLWPAPGHLSSIEPPKCTICDERQSLAKIYCSRLTNRVSRRWIHSQSNFTYACLRIVIASNCSRKVVRISGAERASRDTYICCSQMYSLKQCSHFQQNQTIRD